MAILADRPIYGSEPIFSSDSYGTLATADLRKAAPPLMCIDARKSKVIARSATEFVHNSVSIGLLRITTWRPAGYHARAAPSRAPARRAHARARTGLTLGRQQSADVSVRDDPWSFATRDLQDRRARPDQHCPKGIREARL